MQEYESISCSWKLLGDSSLRYSECSPQNSDGYRISGVGVYQYRYINFTVDVQLDEHKLYHNEHVEWLRFDLGSFRWGDNFILHNACWNILKAYFSSAPIPLDVVLNTLKLQSN